MRSADEAAAMVRLKELGYGTRRIAQELGCSRNTVKQYLARGGWGGYRKRQPRGSLSEHEEWLCERLHRHGGNAEVVRQELAREKGIAVSLRTVERAVAGVRQELRAAARATTRFETPPGHQLQIDFGERLVGIGGGASKVHLFVATLGYSRRLYVQPFRHERQEAWFAGMEGTFRHFGGVPAEVLFDNARALVDYHDAATREVRFNERLLGFARYWGFRPRACGPYRARTKGKDERGVGYVKRNAIAGREFGSWAELEGHLVWWMREIADVRVHGTTGEVPIKRFAGAEAAALRPLDGRPSFSAARSVRRRVQADCAVEVDSNAYSVPWRLIGETVEVVVGGGRVSIRHGGREVACHAESAGRRQRLVEAAHVAGLVRRPAPPPAPVAAEETLLRPLSEYARLAGGEF